MDNQIDIIFWNARSIYNKLSELKYYVYTRKPHLVCIQETWARDDYMPSFINYRTFFKNRGARGGGLLTLVRNDLVVEPFDLQMFINGQLEIQTVKIQIRNNSFWVTNLYNPNLPILEREFSHYFRQFGNNSIVVGDFNAHHNIWDDKVNNPCPTARNLLASLLHNPLQIITPQSMPTHIDSRTGRISTIDLCLVTSNLSTKCNVQLGEDCGSDHCPILVKVEIKPITVRMKSRPKWKFTDEGWGDFRQKLRDIYHTDPNWNTETLNQELTNSLYDAAETVFGQTSGDINLKYNNSWWTPECDRASRWRKLCKAVVRRNPTQRNINQMRQAEQEAKRIIKEYKEAKWQEYVNQINSMSPIGEVWSKVRKLRSNFKPQNSPLLVNNNIITNTVEKTNIFADYYGNIFNEHNNLAANEVILPNIENEISPYNVPFEPLECENVIKELKGNSPGLDMIHNAMIKNLPDLYKDEFLKLINKIWEEGQIPKAWKVALISPILKHGKPERLTSSYRPISLLPCLGKVMERMVTKRLYWHVEKGNILSPAQSGFRRHCSAADQIARLEKIVRETFVKKQVTIVVFIDLKGAYDTVNHNLLLQKLQRIGISGKMLNYCKSFLYDRKLKVLYNGYISESKNVHKGIPQGSSISPLLFDIFTSDIPDMDDIWRTEFADDIALVSRANNIEEATTKMQTALNSFFRYTEENKLVINYQKTVSMIFTRKRAQPLPMNINNHNIEYVNEYKFLGVVFDGPNLDYRKHINKLKADCLSRLNILKSVSGNNWGSDRNMLNQLYDSLILSKLNYGSQFYCTASNTTLAQLDVVQNTALRIIAGARTTSPIGSLQVETDKLPLDIQRNRQALEYYNRLRNLPEHLRVVSELNNDLPQQQSLPWTDATPAPFIVRVVNLMIEYNINELDRNPIPLVDIRPPWLKYGEIDLCMNSGSYKNIPNNVVQGIFKEKMHPYNNRLKIYTDASKMSAGYVMRTSAAMVVPCRNFTKSWRLPDIPIMSAELFSIMNAVEWFHNESNCLEGVIFSDSLSSLKLLENIGKTKPNSYKSKIRDYLVQITDAHKLLTIFWIPSHKGIPGNEAADNEAKRAITENIITIPNITMKDAKHFIREKINREWENRWVNNMVSCQHMKNIKQKVGRWSWASNPKNRRQETALARLRIGHSGLRAHMFRTGLVASPLCECGLYETPQHTLVECNIYSNERNHLKRKLEQSGVQLNMRNLLGGGDYEKDKQLYIRYHVWDFILKIGKSNDI